MKTIILEIHEPDPKSQSIHEWIPLCARLSILARKNEGVHTLGASAWILELPRNLSFLSAIVLDMEMAKLSGSIAFLDDGIQWENIPKPA